MAGRKKLNRTSLHARVDPETPDKLKQMAKELNFTYVSPSGELEGSTGKLLDAIGRSQFLIPVLKQIFKSG
jgi:putative NADH-flavin reductase